MLFRSFQIEGLKFLPETKIKRSYPNLVLFSGISIASGFAAYHFFTSEPENNYYSYSKNTKDEYIATGVICGLFSIYSLIKAFASKKKEIFIDKNINKNIQLKKEIERLREKIKVKQNILKEEK